ncbi:hypothetical protein [Cohaesibacter marisflavi]|uniref:hypothetical protein n=1 Tax=Cohaesibacter marisflavi TaxID=655353 RepID=UPI0029C70A36|nr:hypothetical protein [Cohaesibacter marisflavi]
MTPFIDVLDDAVAFYPMRIISKENLSKIKTSNDAATKNLRAALSLMEAVAPSDRLSFAEEISILEEAICEAGLCNGQYCRSIELIQQAIQHDERLAPLEVRLQISTHLRYAIIYSKQIDASLSPMNNSECLYSPDTGLWLDDILKLI